MQDDTTHGVAAGELRQFIEQYEQLEAEKKDIAEQQKELMAEAKARGYDTKAMRAVIAKRKRRYRRAGAPVGDDLVKREFTAERLDQKWLVDFTEHWTGEGRLYVCAFKDVCSNRIVGYAIDKRMKASLAVRALENALMQRGYPTGVIVHSDRGGQFRSRSFQHALKRSGLRGSMGRVGACGDNAAMESFFSLLQKNVLDRKPWGTREELRLAIVHWIEARYHRKRRQRRLGKLTPVEFETIMMDAVALAA